MRASIRAKVSVLGRADKRLRMEPPLILGRALCEVRKKESPRSERIFHCGGSY